MTWKKPEKGGFFAKEGFVSVALSWIVLSVVGAIPLWLSGEIPNFVDALFEIVSGFTTTGASIAENVKHFLIRHSSGEVSAIGLAVWVYWCL